MKRLFFVRHGLSEANVAGLFSGGTDTQLTPEGIEQAIQAGKEAKQNLPKMDLIMCSPLSRAHKTAELIASEIGYPLDKLVLNDKLIERAFGELEGKPATEYMADGKYQAIDAVAGAETVEQLQQRAAEVFAAISQLEADNILVVGHAAFGRALRRVTKNQPHTDEYLAYVQLPNATIIELV